MREAIKVFLPDEEPLSTYQLDKIISILADSVLSNQEEKMAVSSIDNYRKIYVSRLKAKIELFDSILKCFAEEKISIPDEFKNEQLMLKFLTALKANKIIKIYKSYIAERERLEKLKAVEPAAINSALSDREYAIAALDAEVEETRRDETISQQALMVKDKFYDFREAFEELDFFDDFISMLKQDVDRYKKLRKRVDELAEEAIIAIEDQEDAVEALEELKKFGGCDELS